MAAVLAAAAEAAAAVSVAAVGLVEEVLAEAAADSAAVALTEAADLAVHPMMEIDHLTLVEVLIPDRTLGGLFLRFAPDPYITAVGAYTVATPLVEV